MPTQRFLNLPDGKRKRITDAAVAELSRVPFDKISINRIVSGAGIPRGSFYQYFKDKADLLSFLSRDYAKLLEVGVRNFLDKSDGDVFALFKVILGQIVDIGIKEENYVVCKNILSQMKVGDIRSGGVISADMRRFVSDIHARVVAGGLRYAPGCDVICLIETLLILLGYCVSGIFTDMSRKSSYIDQFNRQCDMLKNGVMSADGVKS